MQFHEGQPSNGYSPGPPMAHAPYPGAARTGRGLKIAVGALSVLLVITAIGAGFSATRWHAAGVRLDQVQATAQDVPTAAEQAHAAADKLAVALTSSDSDNFDANHKAILDGTTGNFKEQYEKTSESLRQLLRDNNGKASGKVVASAVQSATTDQVVVLLFIDQAVSNAMTPEPRVDKSRIRMTMKKVDGRWLASAVDVL